MTWSLTVVYPSLLTSIPMFSMTPHKRRPADRCYECGLEIENGDRPADKMGVARPPMKNLEGNRGRIRALLGGKA